MKRKPRRRRFEGPVGPRIAALRETRELSQHELAEAAGVSWTAVSHWECGVSLPDTERLPSIAKALDVTVLELIKGEKAFAALSQMLAAA